MVFQHLSDQVPPGDVEGIFVCQVEQIVVGVLLDPVEARADVVIQVDRPLTRANQALTGDQFHEGPGTGGQCLETGRVDAFHGDQHAGDPSFGQCERFARQPIAQFLLAEHRSASFQHGVEVADVVDVVGHSPESVCDTPPRAQETRKGQGGGSDSLQP